MQKPQSISLLGLATMLAAFASVTVGAQERTDKPAITSKALELRQGMRELWADHVIWTRAYIVAAVADDPSAPKALERLMKNQEDLGNAMEPYYLSSACTKLTELLKEHISIAGEVVSAAKANQADKLEAADRRWHENAEAIATLLSEANPNWKREDLLAMLNEHLALTTTQATARLQKKWEEDAATFDKIFDQAMMMADALSDGVIRQFPAKFQ